MEPGEYIVRNGSSGRSLGDRVARAETLGERTRGLLGRGRLAPDEGLVIVSPRWMPLMWLHTFGMRFAIDMIFLDSRWRVVRVSPNVFPRRLSTIVLRARYALELPPGSIAASRTRVGDKINFIHLTDRPPRPRTIRVRTLPRVAKAGSAIGY